MHVQVEVYQHKLKLGSTPLTTWFYLQWSGTSLNISFLGCLYFLNQDHHLIKEARNLTLQKLLSKELYLGFDPTTSKFRSDDLTDLAVRL